MKPPLKNWQDTSWETDGEQVALSDVIDHLSAQEPVDINILELTRYLLPGGVPLWDYDPHRVAAASLEYPIIIVLNAPVEGWTSWDSEAMRYFFSQLFADDVGRYKYILDGNHRFQKAINEKVESIKAKILDLDSPETPEVFKKIFESCPR